MNMRDELTKMYIPRLEKKKVSFEDKPTMESVDNLVSLERFVSSVHGLPLFSYTNNQGALRARHRLLYIARGYDYPRVRELV